MIRRENFFSPYFHYLPLVQESMNLEQGKPERDSYKLSPSYDKAATKPFKVEHSTAKLNDRIGIRN